MKTNRRPTVCATSIAAFMAAAAVSPGVTYNVDLGNTATLSTAAGTTASGVDLTKVGLGSLILGAGNTYTGATIVNEGALVISASNLSDLGASTSISINHIPVAGAVTTGITQGVSGGQLLIGGTYAPQTFNFGPFGGLNLSGGGPGGNGSALNVVGNVTVSGGVATSGTSATRIASSFDVLNIPALAMSTVGGSTAQTLQLIGNGHFAISGLTGSGTLTKSNGGTLVLSGANAYTGIVQIDGGSFVRVQTGANLGVSAAANAVNFNTGALEVRTDDGSGFATKGVSIATNNGTLNLDRAVGGTNASAINQTVTFAQLQLAANRVFTVNGRNGVGATFVGNQAAADYNNTITIANNSSGTLTFQGNIWNNTNTTGNRNLTLGGAGDVMVTGSILTTGTLAHSVSKNGAGILTIDGAASTFRGTTDIQNGTVVARNFSSIGLNTSASNINLGNGATQGILTFGGAAGTGVVGSSARNVVLNGTTGGGRINANNQTSTAATAVVFAGTVTGSGATNARTLTLGGTSLLQNEISGIISNGTSAPVSLAKTDRGTWVLSGANTYTGGTTISNGTLTLRANASVTSTVLADAAPVTFNVDAVQAGGGRLLFTNAGPATTETIGAITTTAGHGVVEVNSPGSTATTLATSLVASSTGASVNFRAATATDIITLTNPAGFVRGSAYFNGGNYAFVGAGSVVRAPLYGDGLGGGGTDVGYFAAPLALTAAAHNQVTGAGFALAAGTTAINSLLIDGSGTPTLTMGATDELRINTGVNTVGGILLTGGSATISGGSVTQGLGATGGALAVRVDGDSSVLTLASSIASSTVGGLSKNGSGILVLAEVNNQTGATNINEGTIRLSGIGRISANFQALSIRQGGTLDLNGVSTSSLAGFNGAGLLTNSSSVAATIAVGGGNGTGVFSGVIEDGAGGVSIVKRATGGQTWSGLNTYTGSTTILSTGLVSVPFLANIGSASGLGRGNATNDTTNAASLVFGSAAETNTGGGINYTGADSISINRLFTLGSENATAANGARINAAGLNNATLIFNNPAPIAYTAGGNTVGQTLSLGGGSTGNNEMGLALVDPTGGGSALLSVLKDGASSWTLSNPGNTYDGRTTITAGQLVVTGSSLSSTSPLVLNGGVLETSGSFTRPLAVAVNGIGSVSYTAGGGFSASASKLTVNHGGVGATLGWNAGAGFLPNTGLGGTVSSALILSSTTALDEVEFQNGIDLNNAASTLARVITVNDNGTTSLDRATITGVISGDAGTTSLTKNGAGTLYLLGANTYTGTTNLNAGVLGVTSIATGLGNSANVLSLTGGRLEYLGAGESSARSIVVNASTTINASGSGALVLSNVTNGVGVAARTLTLEGQNSDDNIVSSNLINAGTGALSVTKGGPGTWTLSGVNTFTGALTAGGGNLGVTSAAAAGAGALTIGNGNLFADGGDLTLTNPTVNFTQNQTGGIIGLNSITLSGATVNVASGTGANSAFNNFLPAGKSFTIQGVVRNVETDANRALTIGGSGRTVISGIVQNQTGTTASTLGLTLSSGTLVLGGAAPNTYTGTTTINGGTLQLDGASGDVIPVVGTVGGNVAFGNTVLPAVLDLNGKSETIASLNGASTGAKTIDNTTVSPVTLTFGTNNGTVTYNGSFANSGGGPLSIVKVGTASGALGTLAGSTMSFGGSITVNAGGLNFAGASPAATSGITVAGGASLGFNSGVGSPIVGLGTLNLGAGAGISILGLDLGTTSDTLTTSGAAVTANTINFALNAVSGFAAGTYDLLVSGAGGFGTATYGISALPGGYTAAIDTTDPNKVRLVATATAGLGTFYYTADLSRSWSAISAGNTNWSLTDTGDVGSTPGSTDTVVFSSLNTPPATAAGNIQLVNLDGNQAVNNILFNGSPVTGTLASNVTIAQGTTGVLTISPSVSTDGISIPDNAGTANITAPVELGGNQTWNVGSLGSPTPLLTVSGVMSGTGELIKDGFGTVTLTGVNTRQSRTTINLGVLNINAETALGLNPGGPDANHLTINGGTLRSTAVLTIDDANRGINLGISGGTIDTGGGNITIASTNVISGAGNLTKIGGNTLILNNVNSYGSGTTITGGAIRMGNAGALGASAVTMNGTGAILELADGVTSTNAITVADAGNEKTLRLLAGATSGTVSGNVTVDEAGGGNFRAQAAAGGTLNLAGIISGTTATGLRVNEAAGNSGVVTLSGANTYTGLTEVRAGTLRNGASDVVPGAITLNAAIAAIPSATYDLAGNNETVSAVTFSAAGSSTAAYLNTITTGAGTLTLGGNVTTVAGNAGTQAVINVGGGNLSLGTSTAARTMTVANAAGQATDLLITGAGGITGSTAGLTKAGAGTLEIAAGVAGTYAGTTSVNAGRLLVNGSISGAVTIGGGILGGIGSVGAITANTGSVSPGNSIGTLSASSLTMTGASSFTLEINTSTLGTDLLSTTGPLTLVDGLSGGSVLNITDLGSNVSLALGTKFTFLTYAGAQNGQFSIAGNAIDDDLEFFTIGANQYGIDYNDFGGTAVSLVVVPEPGIAASLLGGFGMLVGLQRIRRRNDRRA